MANKQYILEFFMDLSSAVIGEEYEIEWVETVDNDLNAFFFSLGCYAGERITVISHKKHNSVVVIKDARYNIDNQLAKAIIIKK